MNTTETFAAGRLLDVGDMDAVLRPLLGPPLETADLVSAKPGHRCVVRYRAGSIEVYGKAYADPGVAARTWDLMARLHDVVAIARPLALVLERGLVVSAAVPGRPLDALVGTPLMGPAVEGAGAWLGALHRSRAELPRLLDVAHEASNAMVWADVVADHDARIGADFKALAAALGPGPASTPPVPLHKDFHPSHVFIGEEDTVVIVDVDEARMGHPAFDVAHFGAYLDLLGLRSGLDSGPWRAAFCRGYGEGVGDSTDDGTGDEAQRWFSVYAFVKMAKQLATGRGPAPVPVGAPRQHELAAVLALGRRWAG